MAAAPDTPSRARVTAPGTPSAPDPDQPCDRWNAATAARVSAPKNPVAPDGIRTPRFISASCNCFTCSPRAPGTYDPDGFAAAGFAVVDRWTANVAVGPALPLTPSRARVTAPGTPSAPDPDQPCDRWNAATAARVCEPKTPVAPAGIRKPRAMSACCSAVTCDRVIALLVPPILPSHVLVSRSAFRAAR